jgi:hypothetical protein
MCKASPELIFNISTLPVFRQSISLQASNKRTQPFFLFSAITEKVEPVTPAGRDP